jgi:hypothetical protein
MVLWTHGTSSKLLSAACLLLSTTATSTSSSSSSLDEGYLVYIMLFSTAMLVLMTEHLCRAVRNRLTNCWTSRYAPPTCACEVGTQTDGELDELSARAQEIRRLNEVVEIHAVRCISGREVFVTPHGQCYHTDSRCAGLNGSHQFRNRRPCQICCYQASIRDLDQVIQQARTEARS